MQRLVSMEARVDQQRLRVGWIEDDEWERIIGAMETLSSAPILIDDTAGITPLQMRSKARQWVAEYGELDLIIVDYLQLMRSDGMAAKKSDNRVQIIDEIAVNSRHWRVNSMSQYWHWRSSRVPSSSDNPKFLSSPTSARVVPLNKQPMW